MTAPFAPSGQPDPLEDPNWGHNTNGHDPDPPFAERGDPGQWDNPNTPTAPLHLVDWPTAFATEPPDETDRWAIPPLIARGRGHAMFAKGGAGKSELTLWALARAANGTDLHGNTINAVTTLYLDYEMTLEDIIDRVRSFGYDTDHIDAFRSHLHYGLLPSIDPLDTQRGGDALTEAAVTLDADIVVIDTLGRAVAGEEDSNDAIRAFYRHTGRLLKSKGIALLRIDHAGKDTTRGQRGASAKNDDVDVVLELTKPADDTITVKVEKRRMGWYPERLVAQRTNTDGRIDYAFEGVTDLDPVADIVAILDRLKIPTDWGRGRVRDALKRAGEDGGRNEHLAEALKRRRSE